MPVLEQSSYRPPRFMANGHIQTAIPYFFRRPTVDYVRERVILPDNDFIDVDYSLVGSTKLLFLSHGLEGHSRAQYINGMTKHFNELGIDVACWNYRSCSGVMNNSHRFYHALSLDDFDFVLKSVLKKKKYQSVFLGGFSLGAAMTANYLGRMTKIVPTNVEKAFLYSCPCDLESSVEEISRPGMAIYKQDFLSTMRRKIIQKHQEIGLDKWVDMSKINEVKGFREFDDHFTAPLHDLQSASTYYKEGSCRPILEKIKVPTLIVNAKNDPFLGVRCYPIREARNSRNLFLEIPRSGGHVGFLSLGERYWSEIRAANFVLGQETLP